MAGFRHVFGMMELPFPGAERIAPLIGRPLLECFQALGCGPASPQAAGHFQEFFIARGFAEGRLYDGVLDCLAGLRMDGWGLALASAKPEGVVRLVAQDLGLLPYLDGCYGCAPSDVNPDKRLIVADALRGLAWDPACTVFIGDRDQDRNAAAASGLPFLAAAWGFGSPDEHIGAFAIADSPLHLALLLARHFPGGPSSFR